RFRQRHQLPQPLTARLTGDFVSVRDAGPRIPQLLNRLPVALFTMMRVKVTHVAIDQPDAFTPFTGKVVDGVARGFKVINADRGGGDIRIKFAALYPG